MPSGGGLDRWCMAVAFAQANHSRFFLFQAVNASEPAFPGQQPENHLLLGPRAATAAVLACRTQVFLFCGLGSRPAAGDPGGFLGFLARSLGCAFRHSRFLAFVSRCGRPLYLWRSGSRCGD